jgi:hypothetical protein
MSKPVITKLFVGGFIALIAGVILGVGALIAAFATRSIVFSGPPADVQITPFGWSMVGVCAIGCLTIFGGAIAGLVAWIGAVVNTAQLEDKTWFVVLLVLGLLSFGFVAMLAYVIGGPDGTLVRRQPIAHAPA